MQTGFSVMFYYLSETYWPQLPGVFVNLDGVGIQRVWSSDWWSSRGSSPPFLPPLTTIQWLETPFCQS